MMKKEFISHSAEDTEAIGGRIAGALDGASVARAVIAMRGEMGVGKTAFTLGFASFFEIRGVKSPTYAVMNQYSNKDVKIDRVADDELARTVEIYCKEDLK